MGMSLLDEMHLLLMTQKVLCTVSESSFSHDLSPGRSSPKDSTTVLQKYNAIVEYLTSHT